MNETAVFTNLSDIEGLAPVRPPTDECRAVAGLDAWLTTMRGPGGYGGPVAHWWQQSMVYTAAGLDWRYEGIIAGYVLLWRRTGERRWLDRARQAGDDLINGQLDTGHFAASAFEINPATAGTPHEAACDVALLTLAAALRSDNQPDWPRYADAARWNIQSFLIGQLWDTQMQAFRDSPRGASFVPNKAATICDALFLLADLSNDDQLVERYVLPTLRRIRLHQVDGGALDGAIAQNSFGTQMVDKYFPIYVARCIPALIRGYQWTGAAWHLDSARRALLFINRLIKDDGTIPTVVYPNGRHASAPSWIAALGDVLRAGDALRTLGIDIDTRAIQRRLLDGQDATGGIQTARGFAGQAGGSGTGLPDVRDLLHVVGWCDKAFRALAAHVQGPLPTIPSMPFEADCVFLKQRYRFVETPELLEITHDQQTCYRWRKGAPVPEIATPVFWLR